MPKRLDIKKEDLERLYVKEEKLVKEIAKIYHCHPMTISKYINKFNIPKNDKHPWTSELNKKLKRKTNEYDLSGEYGIGYASNTGNEFYFDLEDYDKIKDYCWAENDEGYLVARISGSNKVIRMHNLITGFKYVDHIKHNPADNRKSELRESCDKLNSRNRSKPVNNSSGCKGVCWRERNQKWRAYITVDGNWINLGEHDDISNAVKARKDAEEKYFKEWSYDNSMNMNTGKKVCII